MPKETLKERAARFGISEQWLHVLKRNGVHVTDDDELSAALADRGDAPTGDSARLLKARADKEELLAEKARLSVAVERGAYVTRESQLQAGTKAGLLIRHALLRLPSDLPPLLTGLGSAEMSQHLDTYARDKLNELSQAFDSLGLSLAGGIVGRDKAAGTDAAIRMGRAKRPPAKQPARREVQRKRGAGAPGNPRRVSRPKGS